MVDTVVDTVVYSVTVVGTVVYSVTVVTTVVVQWYTVYRTRRCTQVTTMVRTVPIPHYPGYLRHTTPLPGTVHAT